MNFVLVLPFSLALSWWFLHLLSFLPLPFSFLIGWLLTSFSSVERTVSGKRSRRVLASHALLTFTESRSSLLRSSEDSRIRYADTGPNKQRRKKKIVQLNNIKTGKFFFFFFVSRDQVIEMRLTRSRRKVFLLLYHIKIFQFISYWLLKWARCYRWFGRGSGSAEWESDPPRDQLALSADAIQNYQKT